MLVISSSAPSLTGFSRSDLSFLSSSSPPIPPTYLEIDSSLFSLPPDTLSSYITVLTNLHNLSHLLPSPETPLTHSSLSALQDVYKAVSNSATQHLLPSPITTVCITGGCEILGLPEHIRAHFPTARILTNLCSPFPCLERWRELPQWFRGSLIKGLCSSTLVSCESDYSLTELTRCCEMEGVTPPHLFSALRGVDTSLFELTGCRDGPLKSGEWDIMASHARLDHLLKSLQGKAPPADGGPPLSIVTVDEDGSPDVLLKLSAADALLATHPTLVGRVQFIFIVTKPPSHMNPSAVLSINEAVGKLNGLHTSPTYNPCSLLRMATPSTDYLAGIFSVCCVGFFPASIEGKFIFQLCMGALFFSFSFSPPSFL